MPARVRRSIAALVLGALVGPLPTSVTASVQASTARTWVPPAYLMWRAGGLPSGLTPKLDALQGTAAVVVVAGDTLWMKRSVRSGGGVVDRAGGRYRFPIEVMAAKAKDMSPFLPGPWHDAVLDAWKTGRGVLGATSAAIRRLDVGDRMVFPGGRLTIGAIVPDEIVAWSEVMVARATGRRLGVRHARFALLRGDKLGRTLKHYMGDPDIVDLWLPYFCISTNISRGKPEAHLSGPLWRAAQASATLPGILPPIIKDGELHVDGGVLGRVARVGPIGERRRVAA